MPGYKTHITFGVLNFIVVLLLIIQSFYAYIDFTTVCTSLIACVLGSIFPDIDITSKMQRIFYFFAAFFILLSFVLNNFAIFTVIALLTLAVAVLKHRTITHGFVFIAFLGFLMPVHVYLHCRCFLKCASVTSLFFVIGGFSHIFLDVLVSKILKGR